MTTNSFENILVSHVIKIQAINFTIIVESRKRLQNINSTRNTKRKNITNQIKLKIK